MQLCLYDDDVDDEEEARDEDWGAWKYNTAERFKLSIGSDQITFDLPSKLPNPTMFMS